MKVVFLLFGICVLFGDILLFRRRILISQVIDCQCRLIHLDKQAEVVNYNEDFKIENHQNFSYWMIPLEDVYD